MTDGQNTYSDKEQQYRRKTMRNIFAIASEAGTNDKSDRIEIAAALLDLGTGGIESYNELATEDLEDILFGFRAWRHIQNLRLANGNLTFEAKAILEMEGAAVILPGAETPRGRRNEDR